MAEADLYQCEEQNLICSICLSAFSDPVSTPCGHNFCLSCITLHLKTKSECPSCRRRLTKGLKLAVNTEFRAVVEDLQKLRAEEESGWQAEPGQVPCDACHRVKLRAVKTCLDCMVSFCRKHPDLHWGHRLTDPMEGLEKKRCKEHGRRLEIFCWDDNKVLCQLCSGHRRHHTVPLEDEYQRMKAQMEREKTEVRELLRRRLEKLQEMEAAEQRERQDTNEAMMSCIHALAHLSASIQQGNGKLLQEIQERQRALQRPTAVMMGQLQKEIAQLERRSFRLECLSNIEDPLQMLQSWSTFPSPAPHTAKWAEVHIQSSCSGAVRQALDELQETLTTELEQATLVFRACCQKILAEKPLKPTQTISDLDSVPEGLRMDVIRQQYEVDVAIDAATASGMLLMSTSSKEVQTSHLWWVNGLPVVFGDYAYVLGKNVFSGGRVYFQVSARMKTGWDVGVARASVSGNQSLTPSVGKGTWVLRLRNSTKLQALEDSPVNIPLPGKLERVGVFVDCDEGLVSFYDASAARLIYSFIGCQFNEPLLPFFSPGPADGGKNEAPLVLSLPYTGPKEEAEPKEGPAPREDDPEDATLMTVTPIPEPEVFPSARQLFKEAEPSSRCFLWGRNVICHREGGADLQLFCWAAGSHVSCSQSGTEGGDKQGAAEESRSGRDCLTQNPPTLSNFSDATV
ncbi:E3 ubiquitin-protein ligase TRIM21-like [Synchiropus picturatus]